MILRGRFRSGLALLELLMALVGLGMVLAVGIQAIQAHLQPLRKLVSTEAQEQCALMLVMQIQRAWEQRLASCFAQEPCLLVEGAPSSGWTRLSRLQIHCQPGDADGPMVFILERVADGWQISGLPEEGQSRWNGYRGALEIDVSPGSYGKGAAVGIRIRLPDASSILLRQGFAFGPDR